MDPARLLAEFGSPLYVYRLERIERALWDLRAALPASRLYYSLKANPHPDLVRALYERGCHLEVSSPGELDAAVAAGAALDACLYTGPAKTEPEIALALRGGVRLFSAESAADLARVSRAAVATGLPARCLVRVNATATGATGLRMSGIPSQFGTELATLLAERPWRVPIPGVEIVGAHYFPLTNARDEEGLLAAFRDSITSAARLRDEAGLPVAVLDLGGGFAAPYAAPGERPRYRSLREHVERTLDECFPGWRVGEPIIAFESGRYLVGDCGSLHCTAMELKGDFLLVDSGINHLGGIGGLGRLLRPSATPEPAAGSARATIVGPLCTPADVLGRDVHIGQMTMDGPVVFPNLGAYGLTASLLGFLSRTAPVEIVLRGDELISATRLRLARGPAEEG